jgi:hypothetical protein
MAEYQNTGDERYRVIAEEAHRSLRILLAKMRLKRGSLIQGNDSDKVAPNWEQESRFHPAKWRG